MNRKQLYFLAAAILLIAAFIFLARPRTYFKSFKEVHIKYERDKSATSTVETAPRLLDGILVPTSTINPALVALMIENNKDGRPVSGLFEARVVYEAPVEGDITRFLAIYPLDELPDKIGPVRSVRPYFLKLLSEWGTPLFLHVGGSADALKLIKQGGVNGLNEFFNEKFYWREKNRPAPYNVYTSRELITSSERATTTEFFGWVFEELEDDEEIAAPPHPITKTRDRGFSLWGGASLNDTSSTPSGSEVRIIYKKPFYDVTWVYNNDKDVYERLQEGKLHRDDGGSVIEAATVIVQYVDGRVIDEVGRLDLALQGDGDVLIFKHGQRYEGLWRRDLGDARTRFFDAQGFEFPLNKGKIWIQIVLPWHKVL